VDGLKVSVIIPIYNTEKYLPECLSSVVNQFYRNIEVILVDDGSTDHCPEICDEWAERDKRIRVIHQKNAGLGLARNSGLLQATGDYVCFVDSDDRISHEMISACTETMKDFRPDMVTYGIADISAEGEVIAEHIPCTEKDLYTGREVIEEILPEYIGKDLRTGFSSGLYMSACCTLFSRELFSRADFRFVSERVIISEDVYSLLGLFSYVESVVIVHKALYYYRVNEASQTHTYRSDRFERIRDFYLKSVALAEDKSYPPEVRERLIQPFISFTIAALKQIASAPISSGEKRQKIGAILRDDVLGSCLERYDLRHENLRKKILFFLMEKHQTCFVQALLCIRNRI